MKSSIIKLSLLLIAAITSCSVEENSQSEDITSDLTAAQTKMTAEAEFASEGIFNLIESAYNELEEGGGRNASMFPDCVTITISSVNGTTYVSLDFGLGCQLNNGNIVSGILNISYGPVQNGTRTIAYNFENFIFNNKAVVGGGTIFRERNNDAGNPQSTHHLNLVITLQNGVHVTFDGTRDAEWIEGVGSGTWTDNVFSITGNRSVQTSTGYSREGLITEALRYETTCQFFVSGKVELVRNNTQGVLDYGEGICDNIATLTVNGVDYTIILD